MSSRNILVILSDIDIPLLLSDFLISIVILSPPMALEIFDVAFGKLLIKSSGEANAIIFRPTRFCGFLGSSS
ncbi:MAG: hypothetical protein WA220_02110 [Candidatus Nitrosopolaris sp.]